MGQNQFLISLALISIFTIAIISMATNLGTDMDGQINIAESDFLGDTNTTASTDANIGYTTFNASGESFEQSSIEETSESGNLVTGSTFKDADKSTKKIVYDVITNAQSAIFGDDVTFGSIFTIIFVLIGTISLLLIWKTWKGGNPD